MDFIIWFLAFLLLLTIYWYGSVPSNLPPGPRGLPLIGSVLQTWNAFTFFHQLRAWSKKYGSVYSLYSGRQLVVVLGDFDAMQEALVKHGDAYLGRPNFHAVHAKGQRGLGLGNSDGELWKVQRRFALSTLRDFGFGRPIIEPRIKDEAEHLLGAIEATDGRPFDFIPPLDIAVSNVISTLVFGKRFQNDDSEVARILRLQKSRLGDVKTSSLLGVAFSQGPAKILQHLPALRRIREHSTRTLEFIKSQIPEALGDFRVDIDQPTNYVQAFYKAQHRSKDDWTFFDDQLCASALNLFTAGSETTGSTLRWAIFYMCHYHRVQEEVYRELVEETGATTSLLNYADRTQLPLTEAVIMEVQRMGQVFPVSLLRRTVAPSKLKGYDIPEGTVVAPLLGAVLSDPSVYSNPEQFDPSRFLIAKKDSKVFEHFIPFSVGKRNCLGESLARTELFIFFTALFSRYRFRFAPDKPKPSLQVSSALIRAPPRFLVCAELRSD